MTQEDMERAIEFILSQQAKNDLAMAALTDNVNKITQEMKIGFDLLIASMKKTDSLVEQVAMLNMHTSKRVNAIERKLSKKDKLT